MSKNVYAEVLEYRPTEGGFERREEWSFPDGSRETMHTSVSSEGMALMVREAKIMEHWSEHFAALAPYLGCCAEHGEPCAEFEWAVNDYVCDPLRDPAHVDFVFMGNHEDPYAFCLPALAHSVPAGLMVEMEAVTHA